MYERNVGFLEAIRLGFRNFFDFGGRAQRAEYWWFYLFTILATGVLSVFDMLVLGVEDAAESFSPTSDLFSLVLIIPTLALGWRRMHDIGKSGWWSLSPILPLIWLVVTLLVLGIEEEGVAFGLAALLGLVAFFASMIYVIVLLVRDSDPHPNRWGPSPKYGHLTENYG